MRKKVSVHSWRSACRSGPGSRSPTQENGLRDHAEEVKIKLDLGEGFTLLDVREPWEFETAHMAGAKLLPMGDVPSRAHQELDPEEHIVVVLSSRCSLDECDGVAAAAGIRESAVDAWRHRCLVAESRWKGAGVLKQFSH